jgi:transcriptional regulator with XRE-family HTH domain
MHTQKDLENVVIGELLKARRSEKAMTILELSDKAQVSSGALSGIENGKSALRVTTLMKILGALDEDYSAFMQDVQNALKKNCIPKAFSMLN